MNHPSLRFDIIERVEVVLSYMRERQRQGMLDVFQDLVAIFADIDQDNKNPNNGKLRLKFVYCGQIPKAITQDAQDAQDAQDVSDHPSFSLKPFPLDDPKLIESLAREARSANGVMIVFSALKLLDTQHLGKSPLRYDITRLRIYDSPEAQELLADTQLHLAKHLFNMKFTGEQWDQSIANASQADWLGAAARVFELSLPALLRNLKKRNEEAIAGLVAIVPDENLWEYLYAGRCRFVYASTPPPKLDGYDSVEVSSLSELEVDTSRQLCAALDELHDLKGVSREERGYVSLRRVLRRSASERDIRRMLTPLQTYCMNPKAHKVSDKLYEATTNALAAELWLGNGQPLNDLVGARIMRARADEQTDTEQMSAGELYPLSQVLQGNHNLSQLPDRAGDGSTDSPDDSVEIVSALASMHDLIESGNRYAYVPLGDLLLKLDQPDTQARNTYLAARERGLAVKGIDNYDLMQDVLQDAARACNTISMSNPWRWRGNDYWHRLNQYYKSLDQLLEQAENNESLARWKSEYEALRMWWDFSIEAGSLAPTERNPFGRGKLIRTMTSYASGKAMHGEIANSTEATSHDAALSRATKLKSLLQALSMLFSPEWDSPTADDQRHEHSRDTGSDTWGVLAEGVGGNPDPLMPSKAFLHELDVFNNLMDGFFQSRADPNISAEERLIAFEKTFEELAKHIGRNLDPKALPDQIEQPTLEEVFGRLWIFSMPWHERLWLEALYAQALSDVGNAIRDLKKALEDSDNLHGKIRPDEGDTIPLGQNVNVRLSLVDRAGNPQHVERVDIIPQRDSGYRVNSSPVQSTTGNQTSFPFMLLFYEPQTRVRFRYQRTHTSDANDDREGDVWVYAEPVGSANAAMEVSYKIDGPIDDPKDFWGHRDALKAIARHLQRPTSRRHFHLYGSKSIGKTSTLCMIKRMVEQPDAQEILGVSEFLGGVSGVWLVISIHLGNGNLTVQTARALHEYVSKQLGRSGGQTPTLALIDGLESLGELERGKRDLVFKEMQRLIDLPEYSHVTWVIASPYTREDHPLFAAIGLPVTLGRLRRVEARDLINTPLKGKSSFLPDTEDLLLAECGGHPFVLQAMCHTIVQGLTGDRDSIRTRNVRRAIDKQMQATSGSGISQLCETWWKSMSVSRASFSPVQHMLFELTHLSTDANAAVSIQTLIQTLRDKLSSQGARYDPATFNQALLDAEKADFIKRDSHEISFAVPLFRYWIQKYPLQLR